jgi:hypothetical protein
MTQQNDERLAADLLIGAQAIADEIGLKPTEVYYYWRAGKLPLKKLGAQLVGSKQVLREHLTARSRRRPSAAQQPAVLAEQGR